MQRLLTGLTGVAVMGMTGSAFAAPIVDGSLDVADYGSALAVQQAPTGFGDNSDPSVETANGSELDVAYGTVANGRLYLLLTGNLQTNFNKLDIFIDSVAGGMNRLTPLTTDQGSFNRMADEGTGNGLTFDTGFDADHWVSITGGNTPTTIYVDYADLLDDAGFFAGQTTPTNGALTGGNGGPVIEATWNNSNILGVTGTTATGAAAVTTGIELSIALADIDNPMGPIQVSAFINGSGQDFLSNQVLGSLPSDAVNLGDPRAVDFGAIAGDQFFTVAIPEPASLALLGVGGLLMLRRRGVA